MIEENRDPAFWNAVANHEAVRPHIGPGGALDLTEALQGPDVIPLATVGGGFLFVNLTPGRYELHTMFLPEARGSAVLRAFREAARHMFTRTDCGEIVTKVAGSNPAARLMAVRAGFRLLFTREAAWPDGTDLNHFTISLDEWLNLDPTLKGEGEAFHDLLETAKTQAGSTAPTHPDDAAHDRAAGAASLMARAGQPSKAVWFYNRWAAFAGYQTIELKSEDPPVIDVRDAIVGVREGHLEVLECPGQPPQQ